MSYDLSGSQACEANLHTPTCKHTGAQASRAVPAASPKKVSRGAVPSSHTSFLARLVLRGKRTLTITRLHQAAFPSCYTILHPHQLHMRVPVSPHPHQRSP